MSRMVSPSSRRLNLMVPWDAGCDGPIWISITSLAPRSVSSKRSGMSEPGVCGMLAALHARIPRLAHGIALRHERLAAIHRIVLAQRMPLEFGIQEDAAQVGMSGEADTEEIPHLALRPQGRVPERRGAGDGGIVVGHRRLDPEPVVMGERV